MCTVRAVSRITHTYFLLCFKWDDKIKIKIGKIKKGSNEQADRPSDRRRT